MSKETHKAAVTQRIQRIGLLVGLFAFGAMLAVPAPPGLSRAGWDVAALAVLMMIWWMTEALPLAVTALAPVVFLPLLNVKQIDAVAQSYAHPLIFLFLGGFLIAKALERWQLHSLIAAAIIRAGPAGPAGLIASLMMATAFLSMWISNTATAMVMVPIAQSITQLMRRKTPPTRENENFAAALMLGIAFSATIGGMATLIGTPPNALLAGYVQSAHGVQIGFAQWMLVGIPILILLLPITWLILTRFAFDFRALDDTATNRLIAGAPAAQHRLSASARMTACIVALAGIALLVRPVLERLLPQLPLSDAGIVITAAMVLFAVPSRDPDRGTLLSWQDAVTIRWDVLILFGGGLALAGAIDSSGLSGAIGRSFSALEVLPLSLVILLIMAGIVYLGELASNTAMAAIFLPIAGALASGLGSAPLDLVLPVGLAASLGFMLPVATPPNAIVYGSGDVTSQQMLKAGAVLDIVGIFVVYAIAMTIGIWVFGS